MGDGDLLGADGLEDDLGLADAELGGAGEVDLADPHAADEGAVAAPEVADLHALLGVRRARLWTALTFPSSRTSLQAALRPTTMGSGPMSTHVPPAFRRLDAPAPDLDFVLPCDRSLEHLGPSCSAGLTVRRPGRRVPGDGRRSVDRHGGGAVDLRRVVLGRWGTTAWAGRGAGAAGTSVRSGSTSPGIGVGGQRVVDGDDRLGRRGDEAARALGRPRRIAGLGRRGALRRRPRGPRRGGSSGWIASLRGPRGGGEALLAVLGEGALQEALDAGGPLLAGGLGRGRGRSSPA